MIALMFIFMCLFAVLLGGMGYMILCEQRSTQLRLARIEAAIERFEYRQFMHQPVVRHRNVTREVSFAEMIGAPLARYNERMAA
jgi:hypothetical protein